MRLRTFRVIFVISALFMCFFVAAGCKKPVGGYDSMYDMLSSNDYGNEWVDAEDSTITPKIRSVFVKATGKSKEYISLSPIALVSTRKVDGMEYLIMCKKGNSASFKLAYIYEAKDGTCILQDIEDYVPSDEGGSN